MLEARNSLLEANNSMLLVNLASVSSQLAIERFQHRQVRVHDIQRMQNLLAEVEERKLEAEREADLIAEELRRVREEMEEQEEARKKKGEI